jgi:hypothetical protein
MLLLRLYGSRYSHLSIQNKVGASPAASISSHGSSSQASSLSDTPARPHTNSSTHNQSSEGKETQELVFEFDKLSAAEMRARLASRKRMDPRQENLSAKQKHQIIQAL